MTEQRVRPITTTVEVCLRCGSTEPASLSQSCSHPHVARLVELRPELADLVTQVRRARSYLDHVVRELTAAAELEQLAGRALLDDEPDAFAPPAGVVFLRPRDERCRSANEAEEPLPVAPWTAPASAPTPAPPKPAGRQRRRPKTSVQPELFQPASPTIPPNGRQ